MNKKLNLIFYNSILYTDFAYDKKQKKMLDISIVHKEMKQFLRMISFIRKEKGNLVIAVDKQIDYLLLKNFINSKELLNNFNIKIVKKESMSFIQNNITAFIVLKRYLSFSHFLSMLYNKVFIFSFFSNSQYWNFPHGLYKIQNDLTFIKKKLFLIGFLEKICAINIKK